MASVNVYCPRCQSAQVYRHSQNLKCRDRFRRRDCHPVSLSVKPGNTGFAHPFNIGTITCDGWGIYAREVLKGKHLTGKIFTQRIERNNLTLRTRIKRLAWKIICFSRSIE